MAKPLPSRAALNERFIYSDGVLMRRATGRPLKKLNPRGYCIVSISKSETASAHRIIWKMHHGTEPVEIDHIDGNPSNNHIENLRAANRSRNCGNAKRSARNTSGFKGVSFHPANGKWRAKVCGKHLGLFETPELAHAAYQEAAVKKFGSFMRAS